MNTNYKNLIKRRLDIKKNYQKLHKKKWKLITSCKRLKEMWGFTVELEKNYVFIWS